MPTYLKNLKINTLGSVDTPANQHGRAVLMKRADAPVVPESIEPLSNSWSEKVGAAIAKSLQSILKPEDLVQKAAKDLYATLHEEWMEDFVYDTLWDINWAFKSSVQSILMDSTVEDKQAAIQSVMDQYVDVLASYGVFESYGVMKSADGQDTVDVVAILKSFEDKSKMPEEMTEAIAMARIAKSASTAKPKGEEIMPEAVVKGTVEEILKNHAELPPEVIEALKKSAALETNLQSAMDQIEIEKNARLEREYVSKAATYTNLPGVEQAEFATILKGLGTKAPEEFAKLEEVLKSANAAIAKGGLFQEVGTSTGAGTVTAWDEVEKRATEIAKSGTVTKEAAIDQVLVADAELYKRYRAGE